MFAETPYLNLDLYRLFWKYINTKDFLGKEKIRGVGIVPDELESVTNESLEEYKDILNSIIFQKHNQAKGCISDIKSPQISPTWLEPFMESAEDLKEAVDLLTTYRNIFSANEVTLENMFTLINGLDKEIVLREMKM